MRIPRTLTIVFGFILLGVLLSVGYLVSRPRGGVIRQAELSHQIISPNADGDTDVTRIEYMLRHSASLSIYFEAPDGTRYDFRTEEARTRGEYRVDFGGVVDGYVLPDEQVDGEILSRLLPDGDYIWVVEAVDSLTGRLDRRTGPLTIVNADHVLPVLNEFTVSPDTFTPNQDGIADLVWINTYIPKEAELVVYLIDGDGERYFIPESQEENRSGEPGRHLYLWDGGVDLGRNPPPDGPYQVWVEVSDAEGQSIIYTDEVNISYGGVPLAEIVGQPVGDTVEFSAESIVTGDVLYFELTVENYGDAPIRTTGPEPGHIYEQVDLFASTGYFEESGAWRVGIHCQTCQTDYPWRWALGTTDNLTAIETNGQTHYYLLPGERAVVSGGIRLTEIVESRNPQQFWAGLIHEDVGIAPLNQHVDPHWIEIVSN